MAQIKSRPWALLGAGIVGLAMAGAAHAQQPYEAAAIRSYLCFRQEVSRLSATMSARMARLHAIDRRVAALTARLRRDRSRVNVNNPAQVEEYKELLHRRDAAYRASIGPTWKAANAAVRRYDAAVHQYNARYAHRLWDPVLLRRAEATLSCPGGYARPATYPPPAYGAPGYMPPPGYPAPEYRPPPYPR